MIIMAVASKYSSKLPARSRLRRDIRMKSKVCCSISQVSIWTKPCIIGRVHAWSLMGFDEVNMSARDHGPFAWTWVLPVAL